MRDSPQHCRSCGSNSQPEQPQVQRKMASLPSMLLETAQHNTDLRSFLPSFIPRMSVPPVNLRPLPMSNLKQQPIHPMLTPTTFPLDFTSTAAPSSTHKEGEWVHVVVFTFAFSSAMPGEFIT